MPDAGPCRKEWSDPFGALLLSGRARSGGGDHAGESVRPDIVGNPRNHSSGGLEGEWATLNYKVPAQSRSLLSIEVTAPKEFRKGEVVRLRVRDRNGNFPPLEATCEVLETIPAFPVLDGRISTGKFTGN